MEKTIGFIGAGRVTNIFLQAFKNKNISLKNVSVFDTNVEVSEKLKQKFLEITITDLKTVSSKEIVFIALIDKRSCIGNKPYYILVTKY